MVASGEESAGEGSLISGSSRATVQVPASTSNVGPGFDCLGIALDLHNRVSVRRTNDGKRTRDDAATTDNPLGTPAHPMVDSIARRFFAAARITEFPFAWELSGEVPVSRGLGSSVTLRLGILHGLNSLCGSPLATHGLFQLCAEEEGHPDNAGPAAFGGFFAPAPAGEFFRFEVDPALKFVLLVPELEILTTDARAVLPSTIPLADAVQNMRHACAITAVFASRQYEKLRGCFDDTFHQRQRAPLVPGLFEVISAGVGAGALGGFLSGSGSTIACLAWQSDPKAIARDMQSAWPGPDSPRTLILSADNVGTRMLKTG